eukprot:1689099-Rhodomonas_salina.2
MFAVHQVKTEGGKGGNDFANDLRKEMVHISTTKMKLPARGPWPKFARSTGNETRAAKVYLDAEALKDGEEWEAGSSGLGGFVGGVACSLVFVPLISVRQITDSDSGSGRFEGSLGGLAHLDPENGQDWRDNVLLEFILALEMKRDARRAMQKILPIFVSEKGTDGRYKKFDMWSFARKMMSQRPSQKTNAAAAKIMQDLGFSRERIAAMRKRSVWGTVEGILKHQGWAPI